MTDETTQSAPEVLTEEAAPITPVSGSQIERPAEPAKPLSIRESIEAAAAEVTAKNAKPDDEKAEVKAEPKPVAPNVAAETKAEPAKASAVAEKPDTTGQEGDKPPSEGKQVAPPARFLPRAKDVWINTPRPVQAEVERMAADHAAEIEQYAEPKRFHEELKEYDGMAKQAGTTVKGALDRYVAFDRQLSQDFGKGVAAIAQDQGKQPQDVIAQVLRAYGVTPQQYAQMVTQNPQAHQAQAPQMQQAPQRQAQPDPVAAQAMQEVASLKQELASRDIEARVIAPFVAANPRFHELQGDIAFFLNSDKVPRSLSPADRLEVAYDMAERLNPSPYRPQVASADPDAVSENRAGRKSISGAPGNGKAVTGKPKIMSIRESIEAASRAM